MKQKSASNFDWKQRDVDEPALSGAPELEPPALLAKGGVPWFVSAGPSILWQIQLPPQSQPTHRVPAGHLSSLLMLLSVSTFAQLNEIDSPSLHTVQV